MEKSLITFLFYLQYDKNHYFSVKVTDMHFLQFFYESQAKYLRKAFTKEKIVENMLMTLLLLFYYFFMTKTKTVF